MIWAEIEKLKRTTRAELRKFGLVIGGILIVLAIWWWWRGRPAYAYALGGGLGLVGFGALVPQLLRPVYIPWMCIGLVLGLIVSTILLTVFYCLIVTPLGFLSRVSGKDFMSRKLDSSVKSYWIERVPSSRGKTRYEQQF